MLVKVHLQLLAVLMVACLLTACATTAGKVMASPFTGVRDVVDVPLVSVTNVFEHWADRASPIPQPGAGVGWSWRGGFNFGVGLSLTYYFVKPCSWLFGGVDYLLCRSLYPNWPRGISPWLAEGERWESLYFPNTKALWAEPEDPSPE
jgi:hypothetical protein